MSAAMVDSVCRRGKTAVFLVSLHRRARDAKAVRAKQFLADFDPKSKAAEDYRAAGEKLLECLNGQITRQMQLNGAIA